VQLTRLELGYHFLCPTQPAAGPPPSGKKGLARLAATLTHSYHLKATHANGVRPSLLQSQSAPTPPTESHVNVQLPASVGFTHTSTEPNPPSRTEHPIRPPSGLDVPNYRPINPNPTIDTGDQQLGEVQEHVISNSDSNDENNDLADFRAIASRIVLLNQAGSLQGAWKQATRRRLLHGAKADGEGG